MKATFEVKFNTKDMCDEKTLAREFGNSWFKLIKYLYAKEGCGIFENEFKLIRVE